jgi:hypothetical protein
MKTEYIAFISFLVFDFREARDYPKVSPTLSPKMAPSGYSNQNAISSHFHFFSIMQQSLLEEAPHALVGGIQI